ncbi:hypothetical protein FACS1894106_3610 [Spirochaetia bacterium]|nr:hypothetical protein FACS1894106_3610 [Spirochaetia bacterium]
MDNYNLIEKIFERDINKKVLSINKCENLIFNINNVFKVETKEGLYIFKLYRSIGYPEKDKMIFVSKKLYEYKIPHAKIYSYNRNDNDLPNGYIIEEYLPGITVDRCELNELETSLIYKKLALLMSDIHKIKLIKYGFIIDSEPDCITFTEHIKNNFIYGNNEIQNVYTDAELNVIKHTLIEILKPCDEIQPCLCHIDIQLKNIVINNGSITLIDWDDARSFPAIVDIARLTLLMELAYDNEQAEDKEKVAVYKKTFFDNYKSDGGLEIYKKLEPALHVWHGLVLLNFCANGSLQFYKIKANIDEKMRNDKRR